MIVKRKLFSFIDEDGNLGYYLYNESTGEEKLFSVVEEEREFARGVGSAVKVAMKRASSKGQGAINKAVKRNDLIKQTGLSKFKSENFRTVLTPESDFNRALSRIRDVHNDNNIRLMEGIDGRGNYISFKNLPTNQRINRRDSIVKEYARFLPKKGIERDHASTLAGKDRYLFKRIN